MTSKGLWYEFKQEKDWETLNKEEQDRRFKTALIEAHNILFPPITDENAKKLIEKILPGYYYKIKSIEESGKERGIVLITGKEGVLTFIKSQLELSPSISDIERHIFVVIDKQDMPIGMLTIKEKKVYDM